MACAAPAPGLLAAPLATPLLAPSLPATLLPRVAIAPAQTTLVRQQVIVDQPTPILRYVNKLLFILVLPKIRPVLSQIRYLFYPWI